MALSALSDVKEEQPKSYFENMQEKARASAMSGLEGLGSAFGYFKNTPAADIYNDVSNVGRSGLDALSNYEHGDFGRWARGVGGEYVDRGVEGGGDLQGGFMNNMLGTMTNDTSRINLGNKQLADATTNLGGIALDATDLLPATAMAKFAGLAGMGIMAGKGAKTADLVALDKAQKMAKADIPREEIWSDTGWFKGADGQWRFEVDDSGASINRYTVNGEEKSKLYHPELRKAYPDLYRDMKQSYKLDDNMFKGDAGGTYNPNTNSIEVTAGSEDALKSGGLHEFQHPIQEIEGFSTGGDPSRPMGVGFVGEDEQFDWARKAYERRYGLDDVGMSDEDILNELRGSYGIKQNPFSPKTKPKPWDELTKREKVQYLEQGRHRAYKRLSGETEARNVEGRMDMTPEQRKNNPPWETQEFPDEEQLIRSPSGKSLSALGDVVDETPEQARKARIAANRAEANALRFGDNADDYKMQHEAPSPDYGFNVAGGNIDDFMPDVLGPRGKQLYTSGEKGADEAIEILQRMSQNPAGDVTIYRAVPKDVDDFNSGDWVTTVRSYAEDHAIGEDGWKILKKNVPAKEVWGNGDSVMEYGWHPE